MKFPSLSRMPRHKRFNFEPRYYDPIKEDIQNRTERIKGEIKHTSPSAFREHIKSAYANRARREKSTNFMQLLLILILLGSFFGWIFYGNVVLYAFIVIFPIYIFLRTRKFFQ
jgi:hypothetical protein